jgi:hypothetical protein
VRERKRECVFDKKKRERERDNSFFSLSKWRRQRFLHLLTSPGQQGQNNDDAFNLQKFKVYKRPTDPQQVFPLTFKATKKI